MCELNIETLKQELQESLSKGYKSVMKVLKKACSEYEADLDVNEGIFGKIVLSKTDYVLFPNHYLEAYMHENQLECFPIEHWTGSIAVYQQSLFCATSPLSVILENIGDSIKNLRYTCICDCFNYFLINPREDVVNWALENKENICFRTRNWTDFETFIRTYQSNPVLCDKVLNTLKKTQQQ